MQDSRAAIYAFDARSTISVSPKLNMPPMPKPRIPAASHSQDSDAYKQPKKPAVESISTCTMGQ